MNDRRRGTLIGLAIGDALGAAVEFKSPGGFAPVSKYRGGGPHGLDAGEWTDDTSMALALADSIATAGWDLNDQADRYVEWWKTGKYSVNGRCFDIGITTRSALGHYVAKKNALTSGDRSDRASGNGSIMRLAPVPIRSRFASSRFHQLNAPGFKLSWSQNARIDRPLCFCCWAVSRQNCSLAGSRRPLLPAMVHLLETRI